MTRRIAFALLVLTLSAGRAHAQWVVIDPANLAQTILIAERTEQHYQQLVQQFQIIQRMARGLAALDRYRIPAIAVSAIDPARWPYGESVAPGHDERGRDGESVPRERPAAAASRRPPRTAAARPPGRPSSDAWRPSRSPMPSR